ncbi:hypothetical protein GCM10009814_40620 [Lapillicoccus jejuensis]
MRVLNVVDEYTRMAVGFDVARSIGNRRVRQVMERLLAEQRSSGRLDRSGAPALIRSDNGKEFTSSELVIWLATQGIAAVQVAKAARSRTATSNGSTGSCATSSSAASSYSVLESKVVIGRWIDLYNNERPHRGLGMMTPAAFDRAERARCRDEDGGCP